MYQRLKKEHIVYSHFKDRVNYKSVYHVHSLEMNNKEHFIVLVTPLHDYSKMVLKGIFNIIYIKSPILFLKIPRWISKSDIFFFDEKGKLIEDKNTLTDLYKTAWVYEFVYISPIPITKKRILNCKLIFQELYKANKIRQQKFKYPTTTDKLQEEIFTISKRLDISDLETSKISFFFYANAYECFKQCHDFSHKPSFEKSDVLKQKITSLIRLLKEIQSLLGQRRAIWKEYENALKEYKQQKRIKNRYIYSLIADMLPSFPMSSTLSTALGDVSDVVKNRLLGHGSIQVAINNSQRDLILFDTYKDMLFPEEVPFDRIKTT